MNHESFEKPVSEGIMHGPYNHMPEEMMQHYEQRYRAGMNNEISLEQFKADRESEWQADQHGEAVMAAFEEGRINAQVTKHFLEGRLRPWWIGHRNKTE